MAEKTKRVALVTGSTSGIGLGIAHRLASAGCDIIVHGFAPQNIIDDALAELRIQHNDCKISFAGADFLKEDEIDAMCMEVLKLYPKGIDILINNAGFNEVCLLEDCSMELWHRMIAVHLTSAFMLTKWALPLMKKKGWGRIVNTSSQMGLISTPGKVPYGCAKSGLIVLAKGAALEGAEYGVTCNAICPGFVETDLLKIQIGKMASEKQISYEIARDQWFAGSNPTKKPVSVEQVAALVGFLCSEEAASITGSAHSIDGGYTAR
ncbi:BDHA-like protein [Mya arenaria]|uniref:3-oxoacyl-[acyl-carrier-protein] reductase n=2 Tax=Mya arenaria TaxID=6604 RepID=A0ABY7G292_MYAAR|nr:BDHA-like protein [Mya arenaria]